MVVGNITFGKLSDNTGRRWLIVFGAIIGSVSLLFFILADTIIEFYLAGLILGLGMSMRGPTIQAQIADATDREHYGVVMGAFGAVSNSAYVISPLLSGVLYDSTGDAVGALGIAVIVSLAGAVAAAVWLPAYVPKSIDEPLPET